MLKYNLTPVKKDRWVFTSFQGHYSDNPKAVSQKLHDLAPDKEIVWLVDKKFLPALPDYVTGVDIHTPAAEKYRASAEVIVDNVYAERGYTLFGRGFGVKCKKALIAFFYKTKSKKQRLYTTWHGTPLKRLGKDQVGSNVSGFVCGRLAGLMGNRFTAEIMENINYGKMKTVVLGSPRNDLLFSIEGVEERKKKLGLPTDKKIVLFAPTFRNDGKDVYDQNVQRSGLNQLQEMDFNRLFAALNEKFGGEWVLVCRFHYHVEKLVDWAALGERYGDRIINGNAHDDMAEYLSCTDVLLTDASSAMFDFSLTKRPCFLFFPDLENYEGKERGFYMPVESLAYPVSRSFEGLLENISAFNQGEYITKVEKQNEEMGFADDENSSKRVVEYILRGNE